MLSTEGLPDIAFRVVSATRRFQKFLTVGVLGLGVNQGLLFALVTYAHLSVAAASPMAILASMVVTFVLNERWTWQDRGTGQIWQRALMYAAINSGGLLINWLLLVSLENIGMHYLLANLVGAGCAAVWNYALNHALTWRQEA